MSEKIRVMLVEDHPEYREVVELALGKEKSCELWAEFGTAERAIRYLQDHQKSETPDVILLDLNLPGIDGLQAIPLILDIVPNVKIIVLTQSDREDHVLQAIAQGASGYLLKSSTVRQLIDGISSVVRGGASLDARVAHVVLTSLRSKTQPEAPELSITGRELEVLTLLAEGFSKKMIADQLSISTTTVVTHVTNIYAKLDAQNAPAAIAKAFRSGLLKLD
ncbi:MAG: response regulator [Roseibacillus sp.]